MFGDIKKYNKTEIICSPLQVEYIFLLFPRGGGAKRAILLNQAIFSCLYSSIEKKVTYKHDNNTGSSII